MTVDAASMGTLAGAKPPAAAEIAKVQNLVGAAEGDASVTQAWDVTPTENNLLVALGRGSNLVSNASISGWSQAVTASISAGSGASSAIWYKVAGAAEGDVILNWTSSASTGLLIMEWSGLATSSPLDKTAKTDNNGGATSASSGTTDTTTVADELVIVGLCTGNTCSNPSWDNGFTLEGVNDPSVLLAMGSLIVSSTGTYESTCSWTTTRISGGSIATFKAA